MNELKDVKPLRPLFPELSDGQIECIYWFFLGLDDFGIAHMMGVSVSAVRNRLLQARERLHINRTSVLRQVVVARMCTPLIQCLLDSYSD